MTVKWAAHYIYSDVRVLVADTKKELNWMIRSSGYDPSKLKIQKLTF